MNEDQKYLFDVTGYVVLEDLLSRDHCERLIDAVKKIAATPVEQLPTGVRHSVPSPGEISVGDLTSADPLFADLIDLPPVINILKEIINPQLRLEISMPVFSAAAMAVWICTEEERLEALTPSSHTTISMNDLQCPYCRGLQSD